MLEFWFENDPSERRKKWFEKNLGFDTECALFIAAIRDARTGRYDHWSETPKGALALIVLLDVSASLAVSFTVSVAPAPARVVL